MSETLKSKILEVFREVFEEQVEGVPVPDLVDESVLLDVGLDSLGFAVLVIRLEEKLGFDPFLQSDVAFYPKTLGEFVQFYEEFRQQ